MKKIAVVEDEEYMRDELCTMLKRAGYPQDSRNHEA